MFALGGNLYNVVLSELSPNHLIHHARVGLYYLDDLGGYVFFDIVGHGDSVVAYFVHGYSRVNSLQKTFFVNARKNEASFIEGSKGYPIVLTYLFSTMLQLNFYLFIFIALSSPLFLQ